MVLGLDALWSKSKQMVIRTARKTKIHETKTKQAKNSPKFPSKIPIYIHRYRTNSEATFYNSSCLDASTPLQVTDLDKSYESPPEPEYSEISYASKSKFNQTTSSRFKKNNRKRCEIPEYIRKSYAKQQKHPESVYSNVNSTIEDACNRCDLVTCHIYETLTPKQPKVLRKHCDNFQKCELSPKNDEELKHKEEKIKETTVVHPLPLITRYNREIEEKTVQTKVSRLVKDENGLYLSPILRNQNEIQVKPEKKSRKSLTYKKPEVFDITPPHTAEKRGDNRQPEERFIVNTYRASCWQRLSRRRDRKPKLDETLNVKVNVVDQSSHSDINSDNENKQTTNDKLTKSTSTSVSSLLDDVGFVGELYRARITPDKILAKNLKLRQRQRRVVPTSLLSMFDAMMAENSQTSDFVNFLDQTASQLESEENLYSTPIKTSKNAAKVEEIAKNSTLDNATFMKLKEEADFQCKIMRQASKALEVSRKSENYVTLRPQVEAEKILLTASCKYEKVLQEIRQTHYEKPIDAQQTGSVQISNICIGLTSNLNETQTGWFVLVVMDDKRIFSTDPVEVFKENRQISFEKSFIFDNLDGNFELTAKIYCLLHQKVENQHRQHKEGRLSNKLRLSGRKLRYMDLYTKDPVENSIVSSSFLPMGYFKLTVNDLRTNCEQNCQNDEISMTLYENSSLNGKISLEINLAEMNLLVERTGMLNVRSKTNPVIWNRRFCTLNRTVLKLFSDETFTNPLEVIDLIYCKAKIENAAREECPRPRTIAIVLANDTIYLNFDILQELKEWKCVLNEVYNSLNEWKLLRD